MRLHLSLLWKEADNNRQWNEMSSKKNVKE